MIVTKWHYEMLAPSKLRAKPNPRSDFEIRHLPLPLPKLNRFFYQEVGRNWNWTDKASLSEKEWHEYVCRDGFHTFVGYIGGTPVGYYELYLAPNDPSETVEIMYFGILPDFLHLKLGGYFLTNALENAWQLGAKRLYVNTCSLDHEAARFNYEARGFTLFQTEERDSVIK